jgi:LuxR family maltose regulon positive regulatory protein
MAFAWMHLFSNKFAEALPYIQRLQVMFAGDQIEQRDPALQGEWLAMQAMMLNGQGMLQESVALANQALALVPTEDAYIRGLIYGSLANSYKGLNDHPSAVTAYEKLIDHGRASGSLFSELMGISALGLYAMERGELHDALATAAYGVERVQRSGTLPPIAAAVYGELGGVYYHWYELEKAHVHLARSTQVSTLSGYSDAEIFHHVIHSRLAQIDGDLAAAVEHVERATVLMQADAPAAIREEVIAQQVRVALLQDNPTAAEALLKPHGYRLQTKLSVPDFEAQPSIDRPTGLLVMSALRVLLTQGRSAGQAAHTQEGAELASRLIDAAYKNHAVPIILETLLIRAQMQLVLGDEEAGQADLAAAVALAEAEGFITIFLEEGRPVAQMLANLLGSRQLDAAQEEHAHKILAAFPTAVQEMLSSPRPVAAEDDFIEPLSQRELEILRLIGEGCTNQEIAERLVITLHTVKKHSSNIYSKLDVRSRTQAVARARELQLL